MTPAPRHRSGVAPRLCTKLPSGECPINSGILFKEGEPLMSAIER
jgi:hypothetical protein